MASLTYSRQGNNRLKNFHRCNYIIWVEGQDDSIFWGKIFNKFQVKEYTIKEAGGKPALEKYIDSIINEDADIIVACDKDYDEMLGKAKENKKILYTYGHSIENTMYCPKIIVNQIQNYSRCMDECETEIVKWYEDIEEACKLLLIYELANEKYGKSQCVMGDTSVRFMENNSRDIYLSSEKINKRIDNIKKYFTDEEISKCTEILEKNSNYPIRLFIRGHFLSNLVINLIKNYCVKDGRREKAPTITIENLFANTVDKCIYCEGCCSDKEYIKKQLVITFDIKINEQIAM